MRTTRSTCLLLLTALTLTFFSCGESAPPPPPGPFPAEGARLSAQEAEGLTFQWEASSTEKKIKDPQVLEPQEGTLAGDRTVRLYRYDSVVEQNGRDEYLFTFIDESVTSDNNLPLSALTQTFLGTDQIYAWEVIGSTETGVDTILKEISWFAVGDQLEIPPEVTSLFSYPCRKCVRQPDNCANVVCWKKKDCVLNTHIATLTEMEFDIMGRSGMTILSDSAGTQDDGQNCIRTINAAFRLSGLFGVRVPCKKLNIVETTEVQALLFRGESLVNETFLDRRFILNDGSPAGELTIAPEAYLKYCNGETLDATCRAYVQLDLSFSKYNPGKAYTLVFHLPESAPHTHATAPPAEEADTQDNLRVAQVPIAHSHQVENPLDCPDDPATLGYYVCRDNRGLLDHVSQHIVVIPLNICPPEPG